MKNPVAIVNPDFDSMMTIDLMLGNVCNYSCHYCHPGSNEGDQPFPRDYELFARNVGHLIDIYRSRGKSNIRIEITGGEPTLWPELGEFSRFLKQEKNINHVQLVTNGSRTLRWFKEYAHYFDEYHLSLHTEQGSASKMCELADYLFENTSSFVAVNVLMDPLNYQQSLENLEYCVQHPTKFLVKSWMLVQNGEIRKDYTPEQLEMLKTKVHKLPSQEYLDSMLARGVIPYKSNAKVYYDDNTVDDYNSFELRSNNLHNYRGWQCNLGVDRVCIINGELTGSCGARNVFNLPEVLRMDDVDFTNKFTNDIISPIVCQQMSCAVCTKDLKIPKSNVQSKKYISITSRSN